MKEGGEIRSALWEYNKKDGEIIVGNFARFLGGVVMIGVHIASITRLKSIFLIFIHNWRLSNQDQGAEKHPDDTFC